MSDASEDTTNQEPWERWNLTPYVHDPLSTRDQIKELVNSFQKPDEIARLVPCQWFKRGRHRKITRCANRALPDLPYCRQHAKIKGLFT